MSNISKCSVCGRIAPTRTACSAYGAISYSYCDNCLRLNLEPYHTVVSYIACAGHYPLNINDAYITDIRRMLPLWGKTEEEFIRDVEQEINDMEENMI